MLAWIKIRHRLDSLNTREKRKGGNSEEKLFKLASHLADLFDHHPPSSAEQRSLASDCALVIPPRVQKDQENWGHRTPELPEIRTRVQDSGGIILRDEQEGGPAVEKQGSLCLCWENPGNPVTGVPRRHT